MYDVLNFLVVDAIQNDGRGRFLWNTTFIQNPNFPIDFSAWVADYNLNLLSVRGYRNNKDENFKNIKDIFKEDTREVVINKHNIAISGIVETFIINENQKYHLIKIIPSSTRSIIFGISMDVTSIVNLIIIGEKACISNPDCDTLLGLHKNLKNDGLYRLIKKFIEVESWVA